MKLHPDSLNAFPEIAQSPLQTLFATANTHEVLSLWRLSPQNFESESVDALLQAYLNRFKRDTTELSRSYGAYFEVSLWPQTPDGPWITAQESPMLWECESAPIGVMVAHGANPFPEGSSFLLQLALRRSWSSVVLQLLCHPHCPEASEMASWNSTTVIDRTRRGTLTQTLPWSHSLALQSRVQELNAWLEKPGIDPNQRDDLGRTPLFYARNKESIDVLITAGADVTAKDKQGISIHEAWVRNNPYERNMKDLVERLHRKHAPRESDQTAILFTGLALGGGEAISLTQNLDPGHADRRLSRPDGKGGEIVWGPLAFVIMEAMKTKIPSSLTRDKDVLEKVLYWGLKVELMKEESMPHLNGWFTHESFSGIPDGYLLWAAAACAKANFIHQKTHVPKEVFSLLEKSKNEDMLVKALECLVKKTRGPRRVRAATALLDYSKNAWSMTAPLEERRTHMARWLKGFSTAARHVFDSNLDTQLLPMGIGPFITPDSLTLLREDKELCSQVFMALARQQPDRMLVRNIFKAWESEGLYPDSSSSAYSAWRNRMSKVAGYLQGFDARRLEETLSQGKNATKVRL